ncbi:MAG: hypothetical protein K2M03_07755, partial [Muribaculaceae bacterium]|nr:hypothetical protein [Muribaculaceae bacterium]
MNVSNISKNVYRVVRSILFTIIILITVTYVLLYTALSVPAVQDKIKSIAERELTELVGGKVSIGNINISPFNEVVIKDVSLFTPDNRKVLDAGIIGAAVSLSDLIIHQKFVITYVELIQLDAGLWQQTPGSPLNIQFIIDAFAPKDKNKPPTPFRLDIRNIVIRKSSLSFDRKYIPRKSKEALSSIDFNHLRITDLSADVAIPVLSNDSISVDLRSLRLNLDDKLDVDHLSFNLSIDPHSLSLTDFDLRTPRSQLNIEDLFITYSRLPDIVNSISSDNPVTLKIINSRVTPADFECFFSPLSRLKEPYNLSADVYYDTNRLTVNRFILNSINNGFNINITDVTASNDAHAGLKLISNLSRSKITIGSINFNIPGESGRQMAGVLAGVRNESALAQLVNDIGSLDAKISGLADLQQDNVDLQLDIRSGVGSVKGKVAALRTDNSNTHRIILDLDAEDVSLHKFIPGVPVSELTAGIAMDVALSNDLLKSISAGNLYRIWSAVPGAKVDLDIDRLNYGNQPLNDVGLTIDKHNSALALNLQASEAPLGIRLNSDIDISEESISAKVNCIAENFAPGTFLNAPAVKNTILNGIFDISLTGKSIPTLQGEINLSEFKYERTDTKKQIGIDYLALTSYLDNPADASSTRSTTLKSPYINGSITSEIMPTHIVSASVDMLRNVAPALLGNTLTGKSLKIESPYSGKLNFAFTIDKNINRQQLFSMPVQLLYPVTIGGDIDYSAGTAAIKADAPYLQQGKDKLIRETSLG